MLTELQPEGDAKVISLGVEIFYFQRFRESKTKIVFGPGLVQCFHTLHQFLLLLLPQLSITCANPVVHLPLPESSPWTSLW